MNFFKNMGLSFKLVLLFLLSGILLIIVFHFSTGNTFKHFFQESVRPHLHQYFNYVNEEIGNPPNLEIAKSLSERLKLKIVITGPDIRWSSDGKFRPKPPFRFRPHKNHRGDYESGMHRKRLAIRIHSKPYTTTFITQRDSELPAPWRFLFNTILGVLLVLTLLYFTLRWMISPLKHMQRSIKRIGAGELDHRIKVNRKDELGELSSEINAMADDIETMLEAKRQLLLAISHELRSPITRAKVALSLMEEGALKDGLKKDMAEMEMMVSELLEAERLNHRHQTLNLSDVNINVLIQNVIQKHFPDDPIKRTLQTPLPIQNLDDARFQFVVKNLIGNALKHRKHDKDSINISTHLDNGHLTLTVQDQGNGIAKEHLPHITEPFYRADPSRQRETGGYGLGLYIIKLIVEAHNGALKIESVLDKGTTVSISLY